MFQRDYMMRLIEQLGKTVGVLMGLKQRKEPEAMFTTIDEAFKRLFGLSRRMMRSLSDDDLIKLLGREDGYGGGERLLACAALLKEDGDAFALEGRHEDSFSSYRKALRLNVHASLLGASSNVTDYEREIDSLLGLLSLMGLPDATLRGLMPFLERKGRYADAENCLFALLDRNSADIDGLVEEGHQFYERLKTKTDEELEKGNLPRVEIAAAEEELRRLKLN